MSQPAAPANLNIRVFTQSGPTSDIGRRLNITSPGLDVFSDVEFVQTGEPLMLSIPTVKTNSAAPRASRQTLAGPRYRAP